ncbi:MAG: hypothetical protein QM692_21135 [Thermomicrobiales bacterium]
MANSGGHDTPSEHDCRHAMTRALAVRLELHRSPMLTESALRERVTALPGRVESLGDGWWRIGQIIDELADVEHDVLVNPDQRRIGTVERPRPVIEIPEPSYIGPDQEPQGINPRYWRKAAPD